MIARRGSEFEAGLYCVFYIRQYNKIYYRSDVGYSGRILKVLSGTIFQFSLAIEIKKEILSRLASNRSKTDHVSGEARSRR